MTAPVSHHAQVVEHLRRHTEARKAAAEKLKAEALGVIFPPEEEQDATPGG